MSNNFFDVDKLNQELEQLPDKVYEELLNTAKSLSQEMILMKTTKKTAIRPARKKLNLIKKLSEQLIDLMG